MESVYVYVEMIHYMARAFSHNTHYKRKLHIHTLHTNRLSIQPLLLCNVRCKKSNYIFDGETCRAVR